jgi:hypothetical protein
VLAEALTKEYVDGGYADCVGVLTLGDEIGFSPPKIADARAQAEVDEGFVAWLNAEQQLGDNATVEANAPIKIST